MIPAHLGRGTDMDLPATYYGKVDKRNPVVAVFERDVKTFLTLMRRATSASSQDNSSYAKGWDMNGHCSWRATTVTRNTKQIPLSVRKAGWSVRVVLVKGLVFFCNLHCIKVSFYFKGLRPLWRYGGITNIDSLPRCMKSACCRLQTLSLRWR